jgi:predicted dehydrogenase
MFRRAAELVRSGILGDIKSVEIGVGGPPLQNYSLPSEPAPPTLDWNRWLGPAPWRPYNSTLCPMNYPGWPEWRNYRDIGGGGFSDFGAHHFDIAQWALGMDDSGPVEVIPPDGKEHDRLVFVYANGVPMYHGAEADCVFNGTKGRILVSRGFLRAEPESILDTKLGPGDVHLDRGRNHRDDWLHCIRTRERPIADAEIGHRTATICQLGIIAFELNRPLRWDPESERFMGDDEANRLIGRPMRGPWRI